jgi:hypothetical protein
MDNAELTAPPPTPANENVNPFHRIGTALFELHRLRRMLVAADKSGYLANDWLEYRQALKGLDHAIKNCLPYL